MAEDWQLKAVHEQFKFFECLTTAHTQVSPNEISVVINKVKDVTQRHLRIKPATQTSIRHKSIRQISSTIISNTADDETFHFAFILIVTDTDVNGSLCTTPLFAITSGNKHVFIDVNCNVYNSWNAFMKSNDLPPCQFCFPVDGKYSVGGKLKIDFAKSPATSQHVSRLMIYGGIFIGVAVVAASFFFHVPKIVYRSISALTPLAQTFVGNFLPKFLTDIQTLSTLVQRMRYGGDSKIEISLQLFKVLTTLYQNYQDSITVVKDDVFKLFGRVYDFVRSLLCKFFNSNSSVSSRFEILETTRRINYEVIDQSNRAEKQLLQAQREIQYEEIARKGVSEPVNNNSAFLHIDHDISSARQLFENCRNESACSSKYKNHDEPSDLRPVTIDLLKLSTRISENIEKDNSNLSDIRDILLSLNNFVQEKYRNMMDTYIKGIKAARVAAGHEINLDEYNKTLDIQGDPKDHFWIEALRELETSKLFPLILKEFKNVKKQKKLELIQFNEKSDETGNYFYKFSGMHEDDNISTHDIICALKGLDVVNFDEEDLVTYETTAMKTIRSSEFTAIFLQAVDERNSSSNGILYLKVD